MKKTFFVFSPHLQVFLKSASKATPFEYSFNGPQSIKHLIEAVGVPHTEVSAIQVNSQPAGFDYLVNDSDLVEVFSFFDPPSPSSTAGKQTKLNDLTTQLSNQPTTQPSDASTTRPPNERGTDAACCVSMSNHPTIRLSDHPTNQLSNQPTTQLANHPTTRFILDNHLGKLASYLRMLGFDCLYRNDFQDDELALLAVQETRLLLTRDHRLLMRKTIQQGYWLRSQDPRQQLQEVLVRYSLFGEIKPFQRCIRCNQLLETVEKASVIHLLQPLTRQYFNEFRRCPDCGQIYWQGSHYAKMLAFIEKISQNYSDQNP